MKIQVYSTQLAFKNPFVLAAGTRTHTPVVFMRLQKDDKTAWAEAALPPYFGLTAEEVLQTIKNLPLHDFDFTNAVALNEKLQNTFSVPEPVRALLTSLAFNFTLHQSTATTLPKTYKTTLTVSQSPDVDIKELLSEKHRFDIIKIKAGQPNDEEFITWVNKHSTMPFCVDVNRGWKNRDEAARLCEHLQKQGCLLVEQPFAAHDMDSHYWLSQRISLPVIADESICTQKDLHQYYEAFSGVNIKLLKCGGPVQAEKMLKFCKEKKHITLIGCMSESSLGCATSARLISLVNYVDLDGPYLIKNDPFTGYSIENGEVMIDEKGVQPTSDFLHSFTAAAVTF